MLKFLCEMNLFRWPHCFAGLRKVRDDEKTHKNKELRKTGPVPDRPKPSLAAKPKAAAAVKKPPVFQLQGKKWVVVGILLS